MDQFPLLKRRIRRIFTFNVLVVGESGLGKTTFVRTLMSDTGFNFNAPKEKTESQTLVIETFASEMELNDRKLHMTITDTPGFGDKLDNTFSCQNVLDFVEEKYQMFLDEEMKIQRDSKFLDPRIHVVIYFLDPTKRNLTEIDLEFMKKLGRSTNIIPVIGRSDTISESELTGFKKKILEEITKHQLQVYTFPIFSDDDEQYIARSNALEDLIPFAIVGSEEFHEVKGNKVRGRKYPWGIVEVENPAHSDFKYLKELLLLTHMDILKEDTHEIHYEFFRKNALVRRMEGKNREEILKEVSSQKSAEENEMKERKRKSRSSVAN